MMQEKIRADRIKRARLAQPIEDVRLFHTYTPSRMLQCAQRAVGDARCAVHKEERRSVSVGKCREEILCDNRAIAGTEFGNRARWR